jgi:hypothetical protein
MRTYVRIFAHEAAAATLALLKPAAQSASAEEATTPRWHFGATQVAFLRFRRRGWSCDVVETHNQARVYYLIFAGNFVLDRGSRRGDSNPGPLHYE